MSAAPDQEMLSILYVGARKLMLLEGHAGTAEPKVLRCERLENPEGFEGGLVTHLEKAARSLEILCGKSATLAGSGDRSVIVVFGNAKLRSHSFSSSEYYRGGAKTVTGAEIRSVIEQTQSVATLPLTEHVLQAVPESFLVNDMPQIRNPLGLEATRLGVTLKIFSMNYQDYKNLAKAFDAAELTVTTCFSKTWTVSEAVLHPVEKKEGAVIIDIADDATELILWREGELAASRVIPTGARALTEKIAAAWGIGYHDAVRVKEAYAALKIQVQFGDELIPLIERNGRESHPVKRQDFQQKMAELAAEWLGALLASCDEFVGEYKVPHPHHIFTGGGTRIDGFLEFLQSRFSRDGRMGLAHGLEAPTELMSDPSATAALGTFRCLAAYEREVGRFLAPSGFFERSLASVRSWFSNYF
ncbi:MAG: cell division FtsA domain-containing protein [Candidatus Omnitrophota bacterium]|jgi:cell division protein FtsA